jgi:hypothetical protein
MALILMEGFDHYTNADAAEKFWNGTIFKMVAGRGFGGQAIDVINNNPVFKQFPSSYSTVIAAAAFQLGSAGDTLLMQLSASGSRVVELHINSSGYLYLRDSLNNVVGTGTTIVPGETWFQAEVKVVVGTSGTAEVHLNGVSEIGSSVGNFGGSNIDRILFEDTDPSNHYLIDDVVVLSTAGGAPLNDYLGDVRIETLYPLADGSHTAWTPKTGTDHYKMVDDGIIDGDGSFVYDATPGDKDSYILETFIGSIYGAQLNIGARKGDASVRQIKPLIRQSGTDYLGSLITLSADYVIYSWLLDNDPSGSPWLAATINADEFGQELIA